MSDMPAFWNFMMASLFQVKSQRLREQLWQRFPKSTTLRWHLARFEEPVASPLTAYERVRQLCQHLDPAALVYVAEGLAPVGKPRSRELRHFEEAVLALLDKHGKFKWLPKEGTDGPKRTETHRHT